MLDASIIIALIAGTVTLVGIVAKLIYSSKCYQTSCKCWGLHCMIKRDTDHEKSIRSIIV